MNCPGSTSLSTLTPVVCLALAACALSWAASPQAASAASQSPPPAPDYSHPEAWAAWPGRPSGADAVPSGLTDPALPEREKVDVFFIHPTTYLAHGAANARYDEPGATSTRIDQGVLRFQASAFNGCCRIYAPHYRQAALGAFLMKDEARAEAAYQLAYADVLRAFDYYLAQENRGRPFILASHSQGSLHAMRLLQERIAARPAQRQLVAAYLIGYYLPLDVERAGVPVCHSATQTGCFVDWNTAQEGHTDSSRENSRPIFLEGRYQHTGDRQMVCVNPLDWRVGSTADARLNLGALPALASGRRLPALVAQLTGARCDDALLHIDIPFAQRAGFTDLLTLFGSYHVFDYNIFYLNLRINAKQRVAAWRAAHAS